MAGVLYWRQPPGLRWHPPETTAGERHVEHGRPVGSARRPATRASTPTSASQVRGSGLLAADGAGTPSGSRPTRAPSSSSARPRSSWPSRGGCWRWPPRSAVVSDPVRLPRPRRRAPAGLPRPPGNAAGAPGLMAGVCVGLSYGWWLDKHNRHHATPQPRGLRPRHRAGRPLVFTAGPGRRTRTGPRRVVLDAAQAWLFFPLLTAGRPEPARRQLPGAARRPPLERRCVEVSLLARALAAYVAALFLVLPPGKALAFVAVHQAVFGLYLGCVVRAQPQGHADRCARAGRASTSCAGRC